MNIKVFESLAESLYSTNSSKEIHDNLLQMISSVSDNPLNNYAETLKITSNPYAKLWVLAQIKDFILLYLNLLESSQVVELQNFILNNFKQDNPSFVNTALIQLFGILTVLGWFKDSSVQKFQDELVPLHQSQYSELRKIGIELVNSVVLEMNYATSSLKKMQKHRKTAVNFRDNFLLDIFKQGLELITNARDSKLTELALGLLRNCLIFDFIGTSVIKGYRCKSR
jgi:hypothetical protein